MESCRIGLMIDCQWKIVKFVITASVMLLAGVCYSCSPDDGRQEDILLLENEAEDVAGLDAAASDGMSVAATEEDAAAVEEDVAAAGDDLPAADTERAVGSMEAGDEVLSETEAVCFVHICGAVACPGVYLLPEGSRIYQAVEMAGGFLADADQEGINLAQMVADGMKVTVFTEEEAETAAEGSGILYPEANPSGRDRTGAGTAALAQKPKVNINTAGKEELMTLRGIGESRAEDIIAYREKHGSFQKIEEIMKVSGIKDAAFEKIKEDITV